MNVSQWLMVLGMGYAAFGIMTGALAVREITRRDSFPNLWKNRWLFVRKALTWPAVNYRWFIGKEP